MKKNTFDLVFCSLISVISLAFLYLSSVLPTGRLASFGAAIFMLCVAVAECGAKYGLSCAVAVGLLSFMLIPDKLILFPYVLFFGYYPVLKLYIERIGKIVTEWIFKLAVFTIAMLAVYLIMRFLNLLAPIPVYVLSAGVAVLYLLFILYDNVLTQLISFYLNKISKKIRKN